MRSSALALVALVACAAECGEEPGVKFSGSYKNLLFASATALVPERGYAADLNRLRLQWKGALAEGVAVDVQYDNEVLLGDWLRTREFALLKDRPEPTYWRLDSNWADGRDAYARQRLYRGVFTFSSGPWDLHAGRQRIAWGTGRFFSALDVLNPIDATALEPGERIGVDALRVEYKRDALSRFGFVHAPAHDARQASWLGLWHGNAHAVDFTLVGGGALGDRFAGFDLAGQLGAAGWRAEGSVTRPRGRSAFRRALLGIDYAFAGTLTLAGELFHEGAPGYGGPHAGVYASYEITPLLKWTNALALNLRDHSRYFSPRLAWSVRTDVELTAGVQLFRGGASTEYGRMRNVRFVQLQVFF